MACGNKSLKGHVNSIQRRQETHKQSSHKNNNQNRYAKLEVSQPTIKSYGAREMRCKENTTFFLRKNQRSI